MLNVNFGQTAVKDDALFRDLAQTLAKTVGATSAIVHCRAQASQDREGWIGGAPTAHSVVSGRSGTQHGSDCSDQITGLPPGVAQGDRITGAASRIWDLDRLLPLPHHEDNISLYRWIDCEAADRSRCIGGIFERGGTVLELGFMRDPSCPDFEPNALSQILALGEPVLQMILLRQQLAQTQMHAEGLTAAVDALGLAMFLLAPNGKIIFRNAAAAQLLLHADGIGEVNGRLVADDAADQQRLSEAIATDMRDQGRLPIALQLRRTSSGHHALSLLPVMASGQRQIVVAISNSDQVDPTIASRLQNLFELTDAESEIAVQLASGAALDEIALARGTSVGTVRKQVKAITAKLGCRRQSEIVAIVSALIPFNTVQAEQ